MFSLQTDGMDEDELEDYMTELLSPLDPEEARAEKNIGSWLKG